LAAIQLSKSDLAGLPTLVLYYLMESPNQAQGTYSFTLVHTQRLPLYLPSRTSQANYALLLYSRLYLSEYRLLISFKDAKQQCSKHEEPSLLFVCLQEDLSIGALTELVA